MGNRAGGSEVGGSGDSATEDPSRGQGPPTLPARSAAWSQGLTNQGVVPILKASGLERVQEEFRKGPWSLWSLQPGRGLDKFFPDLWPHPHTLGCLEKCRFPSSTQKIRCSGADPRNLCFSYIPHVFLRGPAVLAWPLVTLKLALPCYCPLLYHVPWLYFMHGTHTPLKLSHYLLSS